MVKAEEKAKSSDPQLKKSLTGIKDLDEITRGGLPKGRPTLVCGSAGSGKTLVAMEFLVRGALQFNEPGVFMAFEEIAEELTQNVASLGFKLNDLVAQKKIVVDPVRIERSEIEGTGEAEEAAVKRLVEEEKLRQETITKDREAMAQIRKAD